MIAEVDISVELSGGIRDDAALAAALRTGCAAGHHRHRRAGDARTGSAR